MKIKATSIWFVVLATILLLVPIVLDASQSDDNLGTNKTVLGPRNPYLADGAEALQAGDAETGVELTEKGLALASGRVERKAALSNLCAGYLMLGRAEEALEACNEVLSLDPNYWRAYNNRALVLLELGRHEESRADIERGEALQPRSRNLKRTKAWFLDATEPVEPTVEIDDRRNAGQEGHDDKDRQ
ncbi:MAG TPA: tetratricopeptide repeat protein [Woeseiaceae bacterium]|nr:tetratricopeptide repeat protein [Woeseiaceae bacterium]